MDKKERCKRLVEIVNQLGPMEMEEIFKLLHKNKCNYTKNNNGVFINIAWLKDNVLMELERYVQFCGTSQCEILKYESICDVLNNKLAQQTADIPNCKELIIADKEEEIEEKNGKISSSMKFSVLKKKFSKINTVHNLENDLKIDRYII